MKQVQLDVGLWNEANDRQESSAQAQSIRLTSTTFLYCQGIDIETKNDSN